MAEYKFYLKQVPASELADKLVNVVAEVSPNCTVNYFSFYTNSGNINFLGSNAGVVASALRERGEFKAGYASLVDRPFLDVTNGSLNTTDGFNFSIGSDKGFHIKVTTSGNRENIFQAIAPISDALHKHFNLLRQQEAAESAIPDAEKNALQAARTILLDFSSQAARLSQLSASNTERMNEIIITKTEELDKRYQQKNQELDEKHTIKSKELEGREEAFRKERAKFDARENTVVRRDLLAKIEVILGEQKKIQITPETINKRLPVHGICLTAMFLALCFIGAFGYKTFSDAVADLHHIIPLSTGIVLFVSTAIFYIRWNDLWFKEHANAEFENRKFYVDVVRASWIAELLFEWKEKKEVPFPEQLITSYTTGLFQSSDIVKTAKHPFDDVKSLVGNVSEIKFSKKDGISLKKKPEQE